MYCRLIDRGESACWWLWGSPLPVIPLGHHQTCPWLWPTKDRNRFICTSFQETSLATLKSSISLHCGQASNWCDHKIWFYSRDLQQGRVLTKSEFSLNSSYNFWCLRVDTLPLPCMIFLRAWVISAFRFLAAPLSPVVRMVMSIFPVDGSTAACFRASLYNLYQTKLIVRNMLCINF